MYVLCYIIYIFILLYETIILYIYIFFCLDREIKHKYNGWSSLTEQLDFIHRLSAVVESLRFLDRNHRTAALTSGTIHIYTSTHSSIYTQHIYIHTKILIV